MLKLALPALPTTIDGINLTTIDDILKIADSDLPRIIADFKSKNFGDAVEIGVENVLEVLAVFGITGVNIGATIAPYIFDVVNAAWGGSGKISGKAFIDGMLTAHSNIGKIIQAIENKKYADAAIMEVDDLLAVAGI
jgi:hypothetical protein